MKKTILIMISLILLACAGHNASTNAKSIDFELDQLYAGLLLSEANNGTVERLALQADDFAQLMAALSAAEYDSAINDSGIMLKMAAPDYVLYLAYIDEDSGEEHSELLSLWGNGSEAARILFQGDWYLLPQAQSAVAFNILEKYNFAEAQ